MHGSFRPPRTGTRPAGEWDRLLVPGLDDETRRAYHRDAEQRELDDLGSDDSDDSGGAPGPPRPAPRDDGMQGPPQPPPLRFRLKGKTFFVLEGDAPTGPLQRGQYLVPHGVFPEGRQRQARPYPPPPAPNLLHDPLPDDRLPEWPSPIPDYRYCLEGLDFVLPGPDYMQVSRRALQASLEAAEELDLQFAKRMEGLTNCAASVCWDCRDPDFNPADRQPVLQQFVSKYMDRFYGQMGLGSTPPVEASMDEGVRRHREFCKEWARQHLRSLTPFVTAPAEVLTNMFYAGLSANQGAATCPEAARLLARHPRTTVEFASCLQFFTANLEQSRGNRNASYKQMNQVAAARNHELRAFGATLTRALPELREVFEAIRASPHEAYFSRYTVDWPDVLAQIPTSHRAFDDVGAFGLLPAREQDRFNGQPPWRVNHP